jgi:hypothetical protein
MKVKLSLCSELSCEFVQGRYGMSALARDEYQLQALRFLIFEKNIFR